MNVLKITAGYVPPATGCPLELVSSSAGACSGIRPRRRRRAAACSRRTRRRRSSPSSRSCPATGRPSASCARTPVPCCTTSCRNFVTIAASFALIACCWHTGCSPLTVRRARIARGWFLKIDPSIALAAVRERRVRAGHLERVDRLAAENDREERVEMARDPERRAPHRRSSAARRSSRAARRRCCPSGSSPSRGRSCPRFEPS